MMNLKQQENKSALFLNAKKSALKYMAKYFPNPDEYDNKKIDKVKNLLDWPSNNEDLHRIPASAKAIILKGHLKHLFPDAKFSVVKPHFGSINVEWIDGPYPFGIQKLRFIYVNPGNSDSMSDYYDYDLHLLFINGKSGDQHFYDNMEEAKIELDKFLFKKENEKVDYYDKAIDYLKALVGGKL